jgi:hypothetical protein
MATAITLGTAACSATDLTASARHNAAPFADDAADESPGADASSGMDGGLGFGCTGAAPSFSLDVAPILRGCLHERCHVQGFPYTSLVNAPSVRDGCPTTRILVWPGSLEQSYLMNKLTGIGMCGGTVRMPYGSALPPAEIQTIADWICVGAPND